MRIVIIGQAAFGDAVFQKLLEQGDEVVGVFYEREDDPLHSRAQEYGTTAYPARELRNPDFFPTYAALDPELNVMAFVTTIIPENIINFPTHTTIQYHPSLLPVHRGRSAINWAIINGETETGITIFWPDRGIDTGPVLLQKRAPISSTDSLGVLYRNYLFSQGVGGIAEAVQLVKEGRAPRLVQDEAQATYEPPCGNGLEIVQWFRPAQSVYDHIRGCDPQPGAFTTLRKEPLRVTDVMLGPRTGRGMYGEVLALDEQGVWVTLNGGTLLVRRVQQEGQRRVSATEFAQNINLMPGERFGY
jgi:methionyl-tRNA formyltransferase